LLATALGDYNFNKSMSPLVIIQIIIFSLGTFILIQISKKSLGSFKVHGFYRFFVFEFTLALVVLIFPYWFENPFSFQQIVSWILLSVSLLFLIQSCHFLTKFGGSKKREMHPSNFKIEDTVNLVKEGVYKYIRHPMYSSLLFLAFGAMFKHITVFTVLLASGTILFLIFTAKTEEKENIDFFGLTYQKYIEETKMFIPFLF